MESSGNLTPLQRRLVAILATVEPRGTLTGGGALAATHPGARPTRDLDWFWREREALQDIPDRVRQRLHDADLIVSTLQTAPAFSRLQVEDGTETVLVDLVADPVPTIEPPVLLPWEAVEIALDSPYEILVNKLCALLGRAEIRDLQDVRLLLDCGGDLARALCDAPRKDAGFSPLVFAWILKGLPVQQLARASGLSEDAAASLATWRDDLVERVMRLASGI
jgi:hypothetical protein